MVQSSPKRKTFLLYMYKTGDIVKIKNDSQIKYGLNGDFTKNEGRPFVVGYITEQNYYWVVPSFSNGNDYNQNIKARKFYTVLSTPDGDIKYLNYRNMIPVTNNDILDYPPSNKTIVVDILKINEIESKTRNIKRYLKDNYETLKTRYQPCFDIEKHIMMEYLLHPYSWLERDFNKVEPNRHFSKDEEFNKSKFADSLYYYYINNLKDFLIHRSKYIPLRTSECISYFNETKFEIMYKCLSEQGYVYSLNPVAYCDNYNDALLLNMNDIENNFSDSVYEQVKIKVPLLDKKQELENASEIIWLDNNIVSKKTYYDVFGCEPTKQQKREVIKKYKQD